MTEEIFTLGICAAVFTERAAMLWLFWEKEVASAHSFIAERFGPGPNDEDIVCRALSTVFAACCVGAIACWGALLAEWLRRAQ